MKLLSHSWLNSCLFLIFVGKNNVINYKYFFNNFDKAVILSEKESGRIIDINEKALALFCKSTDDFVNLKRTDILPLKAIQNLNLQLKKSATNSNFASADSFIIHKKGDKIPINIETGLLKENGTELFLEVISEKKNEKIPKISQQLLTIFHFI